MGVVEVRGDCYTGDTVSIEVPVDRLDGRTMVERLRGGDVCEYTIYLTKEQLRDSGFEPVGVDTREEKERWWSEVPDIVGVTVWYEPEWGVWFRYCFRNVHEDDYYEHLDDLYAARVLDSILDALRV